MSAGYTVRKGRRVVVRDVGHSEAANALFSALTLRAPRKGSVIEIEDWYTSYSTTQGTTLHTTVIKLKVVEVDRYHEEED